MKNLADLGIKVTRLTAMLSSDLLNGAFNSLGYVASNFKINRLKPKVVQIIFKNQARTSKRTPHFTIIKINWLTLFKEVNAVYSENHTKPINTKCNITECQSRWFI
jgi:hypothetical protein